MDILIKSRRRSIDNILAQHPSAMIIDVTSKAVHEYIRLSPFYPHGDIPVPYSNGYTSASVEGIWQGLKVFKNHDIDVSKFTISTMKGLKRTIRKYGPVLGHRRGVHGNEILDYYQARINIYLPSYEWVLKNKVIGLIIELKKHLEKQNIILLDYETNEDITNMQKPLSHAFLIKYFVLNGTLKGLK